MKKTIIIILLTCFSCQEKQVSNSCVEIEKKYDSILKLNNTYKSTSVYKFHEILSKEKGIKSDSLLIKKYTELIGKDSLLNFYIWDRIHTINFNLHKIDVLKKYSGNYKLRRTYNKKYAEVTSVKISNDSCFIYKDNVLLVANKINLVNSSNESINGKFRIRNYNITLAQFAQHKFLTLKNSSCTHCEQLQFD